MTKPEEMNAPPPELGPNPFRTAPEPVAILTCGVCHGLMWIDDAHGRPRTCPHCRGRGRVATNGGEV